MNDPRASALAAAFQTPPQFANTARSRNQITSRRILREIQDEGGSLVIVHQLVDAPDELGRFDDCDERRRHSTSVVHWTTICRAALASEVASYSPEIAAYAVARAVSPMRNVNKKCEFAVAGAET